MATTMPDDASGLQDQHQMVGETTTTGDNPPPRTVEVLVEAVVEETTGTTLIPGMNLEGNRSGGEVATIAITVTTMMTIGVLHDDREMIPLMVTMDSTMIGAPYAIVREGTNAVVDAAVEEEVVGEAVVVVVEGEEIFNKKDVAARMKILEREIKRRAMIHQRPLVQSI